MYLQTHTRPSANDWIQYVTTAIEAARSFTVEGTSIKLIELTDFQIHQAVMFDANDSGIEVLIELSDISRQSATVTANFTYSAAIGEDAAADLVLAAQGRLKILLGKETSVALLPERLPHPPHMIPVDESRLYSFMEGLEYNFSGPFRCKSGHTLACSCCQTTNHLAFQL
jgi:hypothetical protein